MTEGDVTRKLTFVETYWSVSAAEAQFSHEVLYWACQALLELEQWTGTQVTEVCYTVSEFGDFSFGLTPEDMMHDRTFYSRCYNGLSFIWGEVIESIYYSTDMDVWYSPVKQYTTPPGYDKMTTEERLIWFLSVLPLPGAVRWKRSSIPGRGVITCLERIRGHIMILPPQRE